MERLINLCNAINRNNVNDVFYRVSPHTQQMDIELYDGKWESKKDASQQIVVWFKGKFEEIDNIELVWVLDTPVHQALTEDELIKILESYYVEV